MSAAAIPTALAIAPEALAAYLQNVVDGRPMRDIARAAGCNASTILRRIRRCEELREHPEWDAVLSALESARQRSTDPARTPVTRAGVLAALGLSAAQVASDFAGRMHILSRPDAALLAGDLPQVAIVAGGETRATMRRDVTLAALAFGWIKPAGPGTGRVRRFIATDDAIESVRHDLAPDPEPDSRSGPQRRLMRYSRQPSPLEAMLGRKQNTINADHLRIAQEFQAIYCARETVAADAWCAVVAAMAPRLLTALEDVCGEGTGLEALEQKLRIPQRSGKAVVALALEAFAHAGAAA
jgi:hypothetical protein